MLNYMYKHSTEGEKTIACIMLGFTWALCIIALVKFIYAG